MVEVTIQHRAGDDGIAEDIAPISEGLIACYDR